MTLNHGNDGNSINRGTGGNKKKDVTIKFSADTKEAVRSVRDLERQVDKLGDLADQGQNRQNGFLSSRQVQMYKRILKEMEQAYSQHTKTLENLEKQYQNRKNTAESQKLKDFENELKKREQLLRNAEGGNRWGSTASPVVQEYHRKKLDEAKANYSSYRNSDEYKNSANETSQLEAELNTLRATISRMDAERSRSDRHTSRIDTMHQMDPQARRRMYGMATAVAGSVGTLGFHSYWNYSMTGIDKLRAQERLANGVALTQDTYTGNIDGQQRERMQAVGIKSNYDISQTALLQRAIIAGGKESATNLDKDTVSIQKMARGYALDPSQLASSGAMLRQMGTFTDGQQQRFVNLLAGAIAKEGMGGRQEEMVRATVSLANSVSQGQAQYTQKQFTNVLGLQTALGAAVPSLKGDRGAQLLSGMDSAIKGGGQGLDLLLGKGSRYTGISGMAQLEARKEQGLSNPKNLQDILNNANKMFGGNQDMIKLAMKEQLGLNVNEYDALKKSGLLDQIAKDPTKITSGQLNSAGAKELAKQWNKYTGSETAKVDSMTAHSENRQADHAKVVDSVSKTSRGFFNDLPEWAQHTSLVAGGLFGGGIAAKAVGKVFPAVRRIISPTVGQLLGRNGGGGTPPTGGTGASGGAISSSVETVGRAEGIGSKLLGGAKKVLGPVGEFLALKSAGNAGTSFGDYIFGHTKGAPVVGGVNNFKSYKNSVKYSDTREPIWERNHWFGLGSNPEATSVKDKVTTKTKVQEDKPINSGTKLGSLNVDTVNIKDKKFADFLTKTTDGSDKKSKEQVLRIIIEGNVTGMNEKNQDEVKDSLKSLFTSGSISPLFRYNLSMDQSRK